MQSCRGQIMLKLITYLTALLIVITIVGSAAAMTSAEIEDLIFNMTLDEKVGQMTQAERGTADAADVQN